jgi:hypothetical protein
MYREMAQPQPGKKLPPPPSQVADVKSDRGLLNRFKNPEELKAYMVKCGGGREFRPCWCGHIGDHYGVYHNSPPCAHCDAWWKDAKSNSNQHGHTVYCPKCGAGHWVKLGWNYR